MQFSPSYQPYSGLGRFYIAIGLLTASFLVGTTGFMLVEGFGLLDALFMTMITISTVGYNEVRPLSPAGQLFAIGYIALNITIFAYVIGVISTYIFEGELRRIYRYIISTRELNKLQDHIIVCGIGRNGEKVCEELSDAGMTFVVIDADEEVLNGHANKKYKFILGDSTSDDVLLRAGIERASFLITTLPNDADNVFITLTARELNNEVKIISRASEENSESKLKRAGAFKVVMPDALGGRHMASLITKPDVIEFLELMQGVGSMHMSLEEFTYEDLTDRFYGKTIRDMDIRNLTHASVLACKDPVQGFIFNPPAQTVITPGCVLIIIGKDDHITKFRDLYTD